MMKRSGRLTSCCVVLFLTLPFVSAVQRLNSISDLKRIPFGQSVPEQSLVLLYWFANTVEIDSDNVIWRNFNPNNGDYGSHYYANYDQLLEQPLQRYRYYTVGNLYQDNPVKLPSYVVNHMKEDMGRNRARIIIRTRGSTGAQRIDRVYITQHYETSEHEGTRYDPQHTYEISINLLREIRRFSVRDNQRSLTSLRDQYARNTADFQLNDIRNTWGNLAGLGLLLFIVMQNGYYSNQLRYKEQRRQNRGDAKVLEICCILLLFVVILVFILAILSQTNKRW